MGYVVSYAYGNILAENDVFEHGRCMSMDLVRTLQDLQAWNVSLVAQSGLQFDLSTSQGKLIASVMAALAEFERDLLRERIRSTLSPRPRRAPIQVYLPN